MVAIEWNVERKIEDAIIRRKVVAPQERLATQLDTCREETEHRNQDWHLNQHRQATSHRADARFVVECHHLLLLLHCILLTWILSIQSIDLRLDYTHLCSRKIALVSEWEDYQLHKQCEDEDNQTERCDILLQEVEHRNYNPTADISREDPTEWNDALHLERSTIIVGQFLQYRELVRSQVEREVVVRSLWGIVH